jgi:hypothetical protein
MSSWTDVSRPSKSMNGDGVAAGTYGPLPRLQRVFVAPRSRARAAVKCECRDSDLDA